MEKEIRSPSLFKTKTKNELLKFENDVSLHKPLLLKTYSQKHGLILTMCCNYSTYNYITIMYSTLFMFC